MLVLGVVWYLGANGVGAGQSGDGFGSAGSAPLDSPLGRGGQRDRSTSDKDAGAARLQEQLAKTRNDDRQRRLVDDTAKLYALSAELKEEVAKTDKNTLSVDVVKKAEEIEKLARSVKEKMRGQGA